MTDRVGRVVAVFQKWLALRNPLPIYALAGAVQANRLPGDPVWLGFIGASSTAKTELLNSVAPLRFAVPAATLTAASLLSGTANKDRDKGASGGLLRQIDQFGILLLKDFGSVLSMRPEARAETLAALREIYDGSWTRHLGSGGGKTLTWSGKMGLLFGCTEVYDAHHAVIASLGDRFLLFRLQPQSGKAQFDKAMAHLGSATGRMREELAAAMTALLKPPPLDRGPPRPLSATEHTRLRGIVLLATQLRGGVDRDRYSREIKQVYSTEGPGRLALALERLLAGLDTLGVGREQAFATAEHIALSSIPPMRRLAYEALEGKTCSTGGVASVLGLPSITVRRVLEDLAARGLVERIVERQDSWRRTDEE